MHCLLLLSIVELKNTTDGNFVFKNAINSLIVSISINARQFLIELLEELRWSLPLVTRKPRFPPFTLCIGICVSAKVELWIEIKPCSIRCVMNDLNLAFLKGLHVDECLYVLQRTFVKWHNLRLDKLRPELLCSHSNGFL